MRFIGTESKDVQSRRVEIREHPLTTHSLECCQCVEFIPSFMAEAVSTGLRVSFFCSCADKKKALESLEGFFCRRT